MARVEVCLFVGKEKRREVGDGHVSVRARVGNGECIAEVSRKGIDECGCKFMWGEVGFEVSREDLCNLQEDVELDAVKIGR